MKRAQCCVFHQTPVEKIWKKTLKHRGWLKNDEKKLKKDAKFRILKNAKFTNRYTPGDIPKYYYTFRLVFLLFAFAYFSNHISFVFIFAFKKAQIWRLPMHLPLPVRGRQLRHQLGL